MHDGWQRMMTYICKRFGHPNLVAIDEKIEKYDHRISKVEDDLSDQEARVRMLEEVADPRGRFSRGC